MVLSQVNEALAQGRSAAARQLWEQGVQQLKTAVKRLQQLEKVQPKLQEAGRLYEQVNQLLQQGRYGEALPLMQRSVAIVEQALGPAHPEVADSLHHLASLYQLQGNYWAAEPLFRRSLAILEQALGPAHPEVATSLNNLALLYWAQGNLPQSLPLLQRAADIEEAHLARNLVVGDETYKRQFLATQELAESSDGLGMPLSDLA
ncbi:MAG: tetratricopeptide repeat-containing protein [Anaerolineales bacterium]|nr:tetratricopeptide repeat-containing protein [Anaerolineales bacterium]